MTVIRVAGDALDLERGRPGADDDDGEDDSGDAGLDGFRQRLLPVHCRLAVRDENGVVGYIVAVSVSRLSTGQTERCRHIKQDVITVET